jgi:hypothetical protein
MVNTADKYLQLERTIRQLRNATIRYAESVKPSNCDKKGIGFNRDSRFSVFKIGVSFDSWCGYYGNSGCSTVIDFDDTAAVESAFIDYLNNHWQEIFNEMADGIEKTSEASKQKYIEELTAELSRLTNKEAQ